MKTAAIARVLAIGLVLVLGLACAAPSGPTGNQPTGAQPPAAPPGSAPSGAAQPPAAAPPAGQPAAPATRPTTAAQPTTATSGAAPAPSGGSGAGQPIKVGQLLSITGYLTNFDQAHRVGQEIAAAELNAQGGLNGRQITLSLEDTRSDPSPAVTALNKLLSDLKPDFFVGGACSACTRAMAPIVAQNKLPLMVGSILPPAEDQAGRAWVYTILPDPKLDLQVNFDWMKKQNKKTIAVIHDASPYSTLYKDLTVAEAPKAGFEVVGVESYQANATDLTPQLTKIKAANPDAVFKVGAGPTNGIAAKNMKALGMTMPLVLRADTLVSEYGQIAGANTNEVVFAAPLLVRAETLPGTDPRKAKLTKFRGDVQAKGKELDVNRAAMGHDQIMILADAIKRAGSTDGAKIQEALNNTPKYAGLAAEYRFSADNHSGVVDPLYQMTKLDGTKLVPLPQ